MLIPGRRSATDKAIVGYIGRQEWVESNDGGHDVAHFYCVGMVKPCQSLWSACSTENPGDSIPQRANQYGNRTNHYRP